eukprot:CAMPEP_0114515158 /NCGR_PEP_ID=MMETSP0109-20121206/16568_1 /TAXON_ID=29199 /ORGANISM="Chlorarachnion reptans, Strain CCCM449" /LENGTH=56 /DNA_ID=CAMNT_0001695307 /DNA_START=567 /DNA_END=737 /DNA_ORIENTATION=-
MRDNEQNEYKRVQNMPVVVNAREDDIPVVYAYDIQPSAPSDSNPGSPAQEQHTEIG